MSKRAWVYVCGVILIGFALTASSMPIPTESPFQWLTFAALTTLATLAQLFKVEIHSRQSYYATLVFIFAGVVLLPAPLLAFLVIISYAIEWAKERLLKSPLLRAWYIQPFNIATHIIAGMAAQAINGALNSVSVPFQAPLTVLAVVLAALIYVVFNHVLIGLALVLARGVSLRDSGILDIPNLLTDLVLLCLGYTVAVLWMLNLCLVPLALAPLVLIYRALRVPLLEQEAQTDAKTGLLNARYFTKMFEAELDRARRFNRPLALIMADLDLLRNINNTYGHLAGDAVLVGISQIIRKAIRDYDIAGRFGGEEFVIVLPETGPREAQEIAERLRQTIAAASYELATSPEPIHATMSLGVACFPNDGALQKDLIHAADVAVYQAKIKGRNRVICAADIPHSIKLESALNEDRQATEYPAAFVMQQPDHGQPAGGTMEPAQPATEARSAAASRSVETPPPDGAPRAASATGANGRFRAGFWLFVGAVIAAGAAVILLGFAWRPQVDLVALALFTLLAVIAELFEIDVYGENTVSVSVAFAFALALLTGIPGVACVSAAIVLVHNRRHRPALYKSAFNWATHVLAGAMPVLAMALLPVSLQPSNLFVLVISFGAAGLLYYLVETGLVAIAIGMSMQANIMARWHEQFSWLAGHYLVLCIMGLFLTIAYTIEGLLGVAVFVLPVVMMYFTQKQYVARTEDSMAELRRLNYELTRANKEISDANQAIRQLNDELFLTLARLIDARDPYVGSHATQVSHYATAIAVDLGLPRERIEQVRQAGFLHDIGKIAIPEHILHKPSKLTDEENERMKTHAARGAELLETSRILHHLAPFVRHHHERWDGQGYPDGLRAEQIPLEARILAVCDAVEAMASDRPYHRGMSPGEVLAEVERCAGRQFDPNIARVFIRIAEREGERFIANSADEVGRRQTEAASLAASSICTLVPQHHPTHAV